MTQIKQELSGVVMYKGALDKPTLRPYILRDGSHSYYSIHSADVHRLRRESGRETSPEDLRNLHVTFSPSGEMDSRGYEIADNVRLSKAMV